MSDKRNLGRGLGDLMEEVSDVKAMPVQPAADVTPAVSESQPSVATPATVEEPLAVPAEPVVASAPPPEPVVVAAEAGDPAPMLVEERAADEVINANLKPRIEREIVREKVVPLWSWIALATAALTAVVLGVTLNGAYGQLDKSRDEAKALRAELTKDKLAWIEKIKGRGFSIERRNEAARITFDAPFFSSDIRTTPFAEEALRALIVPLADHAGDIRLVIVGHTGSALPPPTSLSRSNHELGLRRADAIRRLFVEAAGWPGGGVAVRSAGDKDPPYAGTDPLSQARNRTVTIEIAPR